MAQEAAYNWTNEKCQQLAKLLYKEDDKVVTNQNMSQAVLTILMSGD